jgi:ATP-binding cassette subfamily F protein 3
LDTINFRFPPATRSAKDVISATHITKRFGERVVIDDVDLSIYRGEKVALVGVNGAGKTTLMRILAGRDKDAEGEVKYGGNVELAYFAQYDKEDLHPSNTVLGEFQSSAPLSISGASRAILGAFLFSGDDVEKKISVLSGGERTRLRLAKMLCGKANLLMLDEPTNHLDVGSRLTLENALRQYDGAVVLVSHDRYFLDNVVTRVIEVKDGKLTSYQGNYTEYLAMREIAGVSSNGDGNGNGSARKASVRVDADALKEQLASVPKRESDAERRARQEREKKSRNRLNKAEKELSELEDLLYKAEALVGELENKVVEAAEDYKQMSDWTAKLEKARARKDEVEGKWLELQEEIEGLRKELAPT